MRHLLLPLFLGSLDIISAIIAALVSIYLRFDGNLIPQNYLSMLVGQLPFFVMITIVSFFLFKLYSRVWRYAGSSELLAIVGANFAGAICWFIFSVLVEAVLPRSIYILTALVLTFFVGGTRLSLRVYSYLTSKPQYIQMTQKLNKVLVIGAGDAGAMLAREIERYHSGKRKIIGFIDDDRDKQGKTMFGIRVLGSRYDIEQVVADTDANEIIIAMPSVKGKEIKEIIDVCKNTNCKLTILPGVYEIIEGTVSVNQLRPVEVEDLLGRDPVKLDTKNVSAYITGKVVLITGAGGSIGSEICRQVAKMQPQKMLLLGKGENSIYEISQELSIEYPQIRKVPIIADVRDEERINGIMDHFHPHVVFHAAAHKHVPLMEYQPMEAVRNNVLGTKVVAEAASKNGVETFVMISTDKAVNPTSVMGCTKRVAEMFVQSMNSISETRFAAVRFGNVLGSRGSVIPLFKKQIAKGGPVTVTHPDMKRYFMTIPEASQLVLQAGAMAEGGEVFVLDMGEPVKIYDLARDMITLSGMIPEVDIEIKFTGLRPGEKLFEELLSAEDGTEATQHKKIFTAMIKCVDKTKLDFQIRRLLEQTTGDNVVEVLKETVPTYRPNRINC
ncbi:polysaccharide biosynthesis protein [Phascolarctobacterium faecium]|uniref:SDR family NAD(P)-dependent oxidoreductase n=1 Tax=Phascolarctobacterium faecium TaxID=33025 RepID=UPI00210B4D59|nr:polysaccharide biosynthesis protein [Phascolarctobacterium faecium]